MLERHARVIRLTLHKYQLPERGLRANCSNGFTCHDDVIIKNCCQLQGTHVSSQLSNSCT